MKIPKTVKVGGHIYKVEITKTSEESKGHNNWGRTNHAKLKIYIDRELATSKQEETYLHELVHAIDFHMGTKLKEEQVERFSNGLYQVLKDNNLLK